jgi:hypothetical protein
LQDGDTSGRRQAYLITFSQLGLGEPDRVPPHESLNRTNGCICDDHDTTGLTRRSDKRGCRHPATQCLLCRPEIDAAQQRPSIQQQRS